MQKSVSLLGRKSYTLSNGLKIHIPTVNEIRGGSDHDQTAYFQLITPFVCTSTDFMVELHDKGVNFQDFSDDFTFTASLIMASKDEPDYSRLFEGVKDCYFDVVEDADSNVYILDRQNEILINREMYEEISAVLCKMHFREKKHRKFSNKLSYEKAVEFEKKKIERAKRNKQESDMDSLILFAVCTDGFKYNFESIGELSVYDFYSSIRQIQKSEHVDNLFLGGYTGNVDLTKIATDELNKFKV